NAHRCDAGRDPQHHLVRGGVVEPHGPALCMEDVLGGFDDFRQHGHEVEGCGELARDGEDELDVVDGKPVQVMAQRHGAAESTRDRGVRGVQRNNSECLGRHYDDLISATQSLLSVPTTAVRLASNSSLTSWVVPLRPPFALRTSRSRSPAYGSCTS